MVEKTSRVAVSGCGYASEFHLKSWRMVPGAEVVALCDPDPAKRERRSREFGVVRTFESIPALLQDVAVDAYDVVTPPETHRESVSLPP